MLNQLNLIAYCLYVRLKCNQEKSKLGKNFNCHNIYITNNINEGRGKY